MMIRVLIVDDEPWARRRLSTLLKRERDIEIVGDCASGADAIQAIHELAPDLVFLDVQMPEVDGFDVVEAIGPDQMPLVVFATAYDKYALQAFDAHALDYLLKPFDEERFRTALDRARKELRQEKGSSERTLRALLESLGTRNKYQQRLIVRSGGRVIFLKATDVDWIEASGNYVTLHIGKESHMLRTTMNALEPKLSREQFVRIHRSTIVNLDRVKEMQPWFRGEQVLLLKDGTQLTVGRGFRDKLRQLVENVVQ